MDQIRIRAAVLLIEDGNVAVIERRREQEIYFLFPGGGIEAGETAEQAAGREAKEELGLDVEVGRLIAEVAYNGNVQKYFIAHRLGGDFGTGDGAEMIGDQGSQGRYAAVWLPIDGLSLRAVHPVELARLVETAVNGLPMEPVYFDDPGRLMRRSA